MTTTEQPNRCHNFGLVTEQTRNPNLISVPAFDKGLDYLLKPIRDLQRFVSGVMLTCSFLLNSEKLENRKIVISKHNICNLLFKFVLQEKVSMWDLDLPGDADDYRERLVLPAD